MYKFFSVVAFLMLASACSNDVHKEPDLLLVEDVYFDNERSQDIKQIVIEFNQPITNLGSVPTQLQTNAVKISPELDGLCLWRFINLNKLSCELQGEFRYLTKYKIEVDESFSAMGKELSQTSTTVIETVLPSFYVDYEYGSGGEKFPDEIVIRDFYSLDIPLDVFVDNLKLKLPDGTYQELNINEVVIYQEKALSITPRSSASGLPNGLYQLVLPKGFKASKTQVYLDEEVAIDEFWFSNKFNFYGFSCLKERYRTRSWGAAININSDGELDCNPENLAVSFSQPIAAVESFRPASSVDWLKGPEYSVLPSSSNKGKFYYLLKLSGESIYELDLSKIKSVKGDSLDEIQKITLKTQPSTPLWYFDRSFGTVVESDSYSLPTFLRRNVDEMYQSVKVIESANELQLFLNGQLDEKVKTRIQAEPKTIKSLNYQPIDFRQFLTSKSGLAFVKISGESAKLFDTREPMMKSEVQMFQSTDYNLAVWNSNDLVVQAMSWQALPITNANVLLICKGNSKPIELGLTNKNGIAWVPARDWSKYTFAKKNKECWIWTQTPEQFAAIKLPSYSESLEDNINAFAWTAQPVYQPNDSIHIGFIARARSAAGLIPLSDLSHYQLLVAFPNRQTEDSLNLSRPSRYGFADATYELPSQAAMGKYLLILKNMDTGSTQNIGSFLVAEFTAPEFEFSVDSTEKITFGESFQAQIHAHRMNGEVLKNAKAKIDLNIRMQYSTPKNWPEEFQFDSWNDFEKNENGKESLEPVEFSLNDLGSYSYESEPLKSTVPLGSVFISTEVQSDNGEVQTKNLTLPYFSRTHYIGTRFNADSSKLNVIAVEQSGAELNDVNVNIKMLSGDEGKEAEIISTCKLKQLPGNCDIGDVTGRVSLEIESGAEKYKWYRAYDFSVEDPVSPLDYQAQFEFIKPAEGSVVGDQIELNLNSSVSGKAHFIFQAGDVQNIWNQDLIAGNNIIELKVDPSWIPYARVFAALAVDREQARELITSKIKNSEADTAYQLSPKDLGNLVGAQRLLTSDVVIKAAANEIRPIVDLAVKRSEIQAGSEVNLTIKSSVDAESQIWLVNDALLNLMDKSEEDFDYYRKVMSQYAFEGAIKFDALSRHLSLDWTSTDGVSESLAGFVQQRAAVGDSGRYSLNMDVSPFSQMNDDSKRSDFAQSIWLGTRSLAAGESNNLQIQLPQLIGRWRVFALTATSQTMSIDSASIETIRDVEYFLDVPNSIVKTDNADFAITKINKTNALVSDALTLWVDGKPQSKIEVKLDSREYKRTPISLPQLTPGKHFLKVTSENQPDFAAFSQISVSDSHRELEKVWLQEGSKNTDIMLPDRYVEGSLELQVKSAESQAPDWQTLLETNRRYPHQCWEQTLSRAMAYQFNPVADSEWGDGAPALNSLITEGAQQWGAVVGLYSYFPNMNPDPFLTAYTYFVSSILETSTTPIDSNEEALRDNMLDFLNNGDYAQVLNPSLQAKSMALLALAYHGQLDLHEALKIRQSLGRADNQSLLIQALALKYLGADKSVYVDVLTELYEKKYKDEYLSVFNQNSDKCLAAMIYEANSQERAALVDEVISYQQENQSFGSTFADAICSYALRDNVGKGAQFEAVDFNINGNIINYRAESPETHWVKLKYAKHLSDIKKSASGITIERKHYVQRDDKWQEVSRGSLQIGDLLKTTITISLPTDREHILITDAIAGGFNVINPDIENQLYAADLDRNWANNNSIEIRNGAVHWYLHYLTKGEHNISYYSRVRFSGEFIIAPAEVEAMYRNDVAANTETANVVIER